MIYNGYEGKQQKASDVKSLINKVIDEQNYNNDNIEFVIIYISDTNQKITADNVEEMHQLKAQINFAKKYDVELQTTDSDDVCNIIITRNN